MKCTITFSCGIKSEEEVIFVDCYTLQQAIDYARKELPDYITRHEHVVDWSAEDMDEDEIAECGYEYPEEMFYDSQEYQDYAAECSFEITRTSRDDIQKYGLSLASFKNIR